MQSDFEQVRFVVGSGDAGERASLGVAELPFGQRLGEKRQVLECAGDPDLLASGVGVDAARPTEPVGARQRPLGGPPLTPVQLGDEYEKAVGRGVNMGRKGSDGRGEGIVVHAPGMVRNGAPMQKS